jgi:WD40 repeat protein
MPRVPRAPNRGRAGAVLALVDARGDPRAVDTPGAGTPNTRAGAGRAAEVRAFARSVAPQATDIHALIADESSPGDRVLELIRDALRLSAPGLAGDPRQLCAQLVGRTLEREEPEIVSLRQGLARATRGPWLRPLRPALDAPGGLLVMTLVGHDGEVTSLAADADGRYLASASSDGTVRFWDRQGGQLVQLFRHRTLAARAVSLTPNGAFASSAGADGILYLWDVEHAERVHGFGASGTALPR